MSYEDGANLESVSVETAKLFIENNDLERNQLWVQEEHDNPGPVSFIDALGNMRTLSPLAYQLWRDRARDSS